MPAMCKRHFISPNCISQYIFTSEYRTHIYHIRNSFSVPQVSLCLVHSSALSGGLYHLVPFDVSLVEVILAHGSLKLNCFACHLVVSNLVKDMFWSRLGEISLGVFNHGMTHSLKVHAWLTQECNDILYNRGFF